MSAAPNQRASTSGRLGLSGKKVLWRMLDGLVVLYM